MRGSLCSLSMVVFAGALAAMLGCGSANSPHVHTHAAADHDQGHPSEGPHHGHLIELGNEEFHAELTHDETTKVVAVYILDNEAKAAVPIDAAEVTINMVVGGKPAQFILPAAPQASDPAGTSSRFQLADEKLCAGFDAEGAAGRLNVVIVGRPFSGEIAHRAHAGHSHR